MKKLPLITLLSFSILIPTITLAKSKDGYEYNEKEKTSSNNYYFFLEPTTVNDPTKPTAAKSTRNYTLYSKFTQAWLKVNPHEIELSNICKKDELDEKLYDGEEACWSYRRYYYILDKIASQGAVKASEMDSSYYTRELESGSNTYYDHGGYKQNLGDETWFNTITPDPSNVQDGKLILETDASNIINSYKYRSLACSSVKTTNNVKLIETNGNQINNGDMIEDRSTIIEINREYGTYTIGNPPSNGTSSNCDGLYPTKGIDTSAYQYQNDVVYSPVLYNIKTTDIQKECVSKETPIKGTCNGTSNNSNLKCLKTIISGNSKREVKLDQTATLTNILTPTKIYQGGGIKLGFMYYNTVEWNFSEDEKYGDDDSEIRALLASKLKSPDELENDVEVKVSLKDENDNEIGKIDNIQKSCEREQTDEFEEGKTVTTTCTFLLPESIVELGTGKVTYKNSLGQGINNEYYTPITYTGDLYLEATISNIGVLKDVDGWTDNWKLTYNRKDDSSCRVNVYNRFYKPNQSNEYAFIYRPIDLNNPFPNRNAGINWYDWYSKQSNKDRLKSSYSKLEYQVELDNQSVSKIKEYNKDENNNYLNWTGINTETGKSKFIDDYKIERSQEGGNP